MPERSLYALRPLPDVLASAPDIDDDDTLSAEEAVLLEQCRKDWKENPEGFVSIADYKGGLHNRSG